MNKYNMLCLNNEDNVAVALSDIPAHSDTHLELGTRVVLITVLENINFGHKFAIKDIKQGEVIKKYGEVIGIATCDIIIGSHVHVHNIQSKQGEEA